MITKPQNWICIVDDDHDVRQSLSSALRSTGHSVRTFADPEEFLGCDEVDSASCIVLDVQLGKANGLDFQQELIESESHIPIILMSGHGDIPMTVRGMRAGAITFLPKPVDDDALMIAVGEAMEIDRQRREKAISEQTLRSLYDGLTPRERDVLGLVVAGLMNKQVAAHLSLSEITVKIHRGNVMRKMKADSLADLVRMAEALGVREAVSRYGRS